MKRALVLLAVLLGLVLPAPCEPLPGLRAIQQRGRLIVAQYRGDGRPYFFAREPDNHQAVPQVGNLIGIDITLAQQIADYLGVQLELHNSCSDFDDVCRAVAAGEADLGISGLSIGPERAKIVRFSHPYAAFPSELLLNRLQATRHGVRRMPNFYRMRTLPNLTFALSQGTAGVALARELFPKAQILSVPLSQDPAAYILEHDIVATVANQLDNELRFADNENYELYLQRFSLPTTVDRLGVAVGAANPDLLEFVNAVIDTRILLTDPKKVLDTYFPAGKHYGLKPASVQPTHNDPLPVLPLGLLVLACSAAWLRLARPDTRPAPTALPETIRSQIAPELAPTSDRLAWLEWLKNPWVSVLAAIGGILLGLLQPELARHTRVLGDLFVNLLALSALPIIVCAVISSIAEALRGKAIGRYLGRTLLVFLLGALLAASVGAFLAAGALEFFSPSRATLDTIGGVLRTQNIPTFASNLDPDDLLKAIVPANVFETFSSGHLLGIVLVSVLLGTSLGLLPNDAGQTLHALVTETHRTFLQILDWTIYLTPIGFGSLIAASIASLGPAVIVSLGEILILQYLGQLLLCLLYLLAISRSSGVGLGRCVRLLRQSITVSIVTMDPIPAIPLAMEEMSIGLQQPRRVGNFVIPLSVVLSGHNLTFQLSLMAVFVAHIFGVQVTLAGYLAMIALAAFPGSLAGPSMPTLIAMVPFVLGPLALPVAPGMALILVTGPLIAPICGVHSLLAAVANSAIVSRTQVSEGSP